MDVAAGRISILPGRRQLDRLDGGITLNPPRTHVGAAQNLRRCEGRGQEEKSAAHHYLQPKIRHLTLLDPFFTPLG